MKVSERTKRPEPWRLSGAGERKFHFALVVFQVAAMVAALWATNHQNQTTSRHHKNRRNPTPVTKRRKPQRRQNRRRSQRNSAPSRLQGVTYNVSGAAFAASSCARVASVLQETSGSAAIAARQSEHRHRPSGSVSRIRRIAAAVSCGPSHQHGPLNASPVSIRQVLGLAQIGHRAFCRQNGISSVTGFSRLSEIGIRAYSSRPSSFFKGATSPSMATNSCSVSTGTLFF